MKYSTTIGDRTFIIEINNDDEVIVDGERQPIDLQSIDGLGTYSLIFSNQSFETMVEERGDELGVLVRGQVYRVDVQDERARRLAEASGGLNTPSGEIAVKSPMPGLIVAVRVAAEQTVQKGDTLIILESMKMENELKAPRDGKVRSVRVEPRQTVEQGQLLIIME